MDREDAINQIMWLTDSTGEMANPPDKNRPYAWTAIVGVLGNPAEYTDEELVKIAEFSKKQTDSYDARWNTKAGANLIILMKRSDSLSTYWMRFRQTWTMGSFYSETLDAALDVFNRDLRP